MAQSTAHKLIIGISGIGKTYALEQIAAKNGYLINMADSQRAIVDKLAGFCNAEIPNKTSLGEATTIIIENVKLITRPILLDNLDLASERTLKSLVIPLCQNAAYGVIATANISTPAKARRVDLVRSFFRVEELTPITKEAATNLLWQHCDKNKLKNREKHVKDHILRTANGVPGVIVAYARRIENGGLAELRTIEPKVKHINVSLLLVFIAIVGLYVLRLNLPKENLGDQVIVGIIFAIMMIVRMLFTRSAKEVI